MDTEGFLKKHRTRYVWSNPKADLQLAIRRMLVRPVFDDLLDAALLVGMDYLETEWAILKTHSSTETTRATQ